MTVSTYNRVELKTDKIHYSPILWSLDTSGNGVVKKNGMYLPVTIPGVEQKLKMQIDLGVSSSMFYLKTINALGVNNPEILKNLSVSDDRYSYLNPGIEINDGIRLHADRIPVLRSAGHDTLPAAFPVIGSLGYDIIGDNILIIDFPDNRMALIEKLPPIMESRSTFIKKADLKKFPVILPFRIGEKKIRLFYDTGSSAFRILTGTRRLKKTSKGREIEIADSVNSWGKTVYLYKSKIPQKSENLFIGPYDLGNVEIIGTDKLNPLSMTGRYLYGITGNEVFRDAILIIDRKNNRFGIIKPF